MYSNYTKNTRMSTFITYIKIYMFTINNSIIIFNIIFVVILY